MNTPPHWLAWLKTIHREPGTRRVRTCALLGDLLGGSIEVACIWQHDRVVAIAWCPGVLPPQGLAHGTIVAQLGMMMHGRGGLSKIATLRSTGRWHEPIRVWCEREAKNVATVDEAAERAIRAAFGVGIGRGLSAIEVHAGEVFLVFDGHGKRRLEPSHIAAICEAMGVGAGVERPSS